MYLILTLAGCSGQVQRNTGASAESRSYDSAGGGGPRVPRESKPEIPEGENNPLIERRKFLSIIMGLMGTPYSTSGGDSSGFDCSGFTAMVYRDAAGINLPRSCAEQCSSAWEVPGGSLKFGDLVFFDTNGEGVSHVGIYVGDGLFAHSSASAGVVISILKGDYYRRHYAGFRRVIR